MSTIGVLVVDDDFRVARIHGEYLERVPGFSVLGLAHTAAAAEQAVGELRPDLVLLDLYLPDEHGLSLVGRLRDRPGASPDIIAITAARDVATVRSAMQVGVVHYLVKPFRFDTLRQRLIGYRTWAEESRHLDEADQGDVDHLFGLLRSHDASPLPKGHSEPTLALVRSAFADDSVDLCAAEVARHLGLSRPTAHRYLTYLTRTGALELHLHYGATGRPLHRYRRARPSRTGGR